MKRGRRSSVFTVAAEANLCLMNLVSALQDGDFKTVERLKNRRDFLLSKIDKAVRNKRYQVKLLNGR